MADNTRPFVIGKDFKIEVIQEARTKLQVSKWSRKANLKDRKGDQIDTIRRLKPGAMKVEMIGNRQPVLLQMRHVHQSYKIRYYEGYYPYDCLLYTSPSPRDRTRSRMPSSA